jgi:hypothetical protein
MGEKRSASRLLVEKPEGNISLRRARSRWIDNIKMNVGEIRRDDRTGLVWLGIGTSGGLL